ncbi:MAG: hypothetical protein DRQ51_09205 [Gammaproteobacteria bacterium]|nr:MAG: hypothetical protein DRQ51_09205 [Gammaproteobacteria bacterium]
MKLVSFKNIKDYHFSLKFENNFFKDKNLEKLIKNKVKITDLKTAKINTEWGCLEFNNGKIDIEPATLYKFCTQN